MMLLHDVKQSLVMTRNMSNIVLINEMILVRLVQLLLDNRRLIARLNIRLNHIMVVLRVGTKRVRRQTFRGNTCLIHKRQFIGVKLALFIGPRPHINRARARNLIRHRIGQTRQHIFRQMCTSMNIANHNILANLKLVVGEKLHGKRIATCTHNIVNLQMIHGALRAYKRQRMHFSASIATLQWPVLVTMSAIIRRLVIATNITAEFANILQIINLNLVDDHTGHVIDTQSKHTLRHMQHNIAITAALGNAHRFALLDPSIDFRRHHRVAQHTPILAQFMNGILRIRVRTANIFTVRGLQSIVRHSRKIHNIIEWAFGEHNAWNLPRIFVQSVNMHIGEDGGFRRAWSTANRKHRRAIRVEEDTIHGRRRRQALDVLKRLSRFLNTHWILIHILIVHAVDMVVKHNVHLTLQFINHLVNGECTTIAELD
mmetsp:Transcript_26979/g.44252  ORF Transcript_26979/g.44252 Transcript_26979/m.44252 type:complete len:429 (+) Transcript_26979:811-2097(+)